jgi:glycerol-3-phosphate dehydrogenase (NAD(P)+)
LFELGYIRPHLNSKLKAKNLRCCVIGSGSWATAIVKILSESSAISQINWWLRKPSYVDFYNQYGHNPNYLSSVLFDRNKVVAFSELQGSLQDVDFVVLALPSAFVAETLEGLSSDSFQNKVLISAVKGLVPETRQLVTDYMSEKFNVDKLNIACVSGPCHAEEVARERLSYLTAASSDQALASTLATLFSCRYVYSTPANHMEGIEYAAVLKNVYAVAAGIANGLGYGDNFMAVLISFASREMSAFLANMKCNQQEVLNSAYLGDLLVTCYSQFSRNRTFGNMLGRGYAVKSAQMEMKMIAEGYFSAKQLFLLNQEKAQAEMPILQSVYAVIYQEANPKDTFESLSKKLS